MGEPIIVERCQGGGWGLTVKGGEGHRWLAAEIIVFIVRVRGVGALGGGKSCRCGVCRERESWGCSHQQVAGAGGLREHVGLMGMVGCWSGWS